MRDKSVAYSRWIGIGGFIVAAILLIIAFALSTSMNVEKTESIAEIDSNKDTNNLVITTSHGIDKTVNEVKQDNTTATNHVVNVQEIYDVKEETSVENKVEQVAAVSDNETKLEEKDDEPQDEEKKIIRPLDGEIVKEFSMDSLIYSETLQEWITHKGIDIKAEKETEVKAIADGKIKSIKVDPRYGNTITIIHKDGYESVYSCLLNTEDVKENDEVKKGQVIGKVGNSGVFETAIGNHLHLEILKNGEYVNPELVIG